MVGDLDMRFQPDSSAWAYPARSGGPARPVTIE